MARIETGFSGMLWEENPRKAGWIARLRGSTRHIARRSLPRSGGTIKGAEAVGCLPDTPGIWLRALSPSTLNRLHLDRAINRFRP